MVDWLVQAKWEMAPAGFLSPSEQVIFERLRSPKRQQDWLLGRWTAKRLIQKMDGRGLPLASIVVENDGDGVPAVTLPGYSLSISHCDGQAFCAAAARPGIAIGADMEKIEPRLPTFATDYFTPEELAQLNEVTRPVLETVIWSAKEAVLKALHLGLSVDTRAVTCLFPAGEFRPGHWQPFTIDYNHHLLPPKRWPVLSGRWQIMGQYILTLALEQNLLAEI